ncbi:hypothetical protein [Pseudorhodoplanes sp.]|uniref:hypothetical protein n=1 Tax=Pseudorhodoplanes sp. TaxID=1934341 RepID=UPI003D0CD973
MRQGSRFFRAMRGWFAGTGASRQISSPPPLTATAVYDPNASVPRPPELRDAELEWLKAKHDDPGLTPQERIAMFQRLIGEADREIATLETELADLMREERAYR